MLDTMQKLAILGESARYDVSCSTSGVERANSGKGIGNASIGGICHTWTEDGRCVSLLKVLLSNACEYDCAYCANRRSNDIPRAAFQPEELAALTIEFYRRNYIEGLFLSSGVIQSGSYDRTLYPNPAPAAAPIRLQWLYPCKGDSRRVTGPAGTAWTVGGPGKCQYRAVYGSLIESAGAAENSCSDRAADAVPV